MGAMGQPSCIGAGIEFKNIFLLMKLLFGMANDLD